MSYLLEITQSEMEELDAIIARWGNPDANFDSQAERIMCTTLHPLLLQLKSVCTVPAVPEVPATGKPWDDVLLIPLDDTRPYPLGEVVTNKQRVPSQGTFNGSSTILEMTVPEGQGELDNIEFEQTGIVNNNQQINLSETEFTNNDTVVTIPVLGTELEP